MEHITHQETPVTVEDIRFFRNAIKAASSEDETIRDQARASIPQLLEVSDRKIELASTLASGIGKDSLGNPQIVLYEGPRKNIRAYKKVARAFGIGKESIDLKVLGTSCAHTDRTRS